MITSRTEYEEIDVLDGNVSSERSTPSAVLSDEGYLAIGVYLVLLGIVALVGNATALTVIVSRLKVVLKLHNVLLFNMAFADLLVTLSSYPMTAISSFYGKWVFSEMTCEVGGFLVFMLTMVSMDTLTFIAVFRYILVCRPKYHHWLKSSVAWPMVGAAWIHAGVWAVLPLLGWNRYEPEGFKTSCTVDWDSTDPRDVSYVAMTVLTCYGLHLAVIVFCYGSIAVRCGGVTLTEARSGSLIRLEELLWQHKVVTETEVTKMCGVMVGCFMLCWTPYAAISFLPLAGVVPDPKLSTLPTMFAKLSCALNPIIYAFMSPGFRQATRSMCSCYRGPRCKPDSSVTIEMLANGTRTSKSHDPLRVRHYRGDMTNQGVYIGNMQVSLQVDSSVF